MSDRPLHQYSVSRRQKEPLLRFITDALEASGCKVIKTSGPEKAPFRVSFLTPIGDPSGIVVYAFYANKRETKNRPKDEYRFQLKYGSATGKMELWQDPFGIYTTLLLGISPEEEFFVAFDPVLHNPTKDFISLEFKEEFVEEILKSGWTWRERARKRRLDEPIEILVGGKATAFLDLVMFERETLSEDQGHRQLLAEQRAPGGAMSGKQAKSTDVQALCEELELSASEVLDLIGRAPRLKMAVRGWVAEEHLQRALSQAPDVTKCRRLEGDKGPDLELFYRGRGPLTVECKNVLRNTARDGSIRLDFQRTRASKKDPCTRYYSPQDFDLIAACTHAVTQSWQFKFAIPGQLDPHKKCEGKLASTVRLDNRWTDDVRGILGEISTR